jgi:hypothetical protein
MWGLLSAGTPPGLAAAGSATLLPGRPKNRSRTGEDGDQITQQRLDVMNCFAVGKKGLSMKLADGFFWRVFHTYILSIVFGKT